MTPLVIGLDVSTTAAKAVAVDLKGTVVAEGRAVFPLQNPSPGAWEQDAKSWTRAAMEALRATTQALGDRAGEVRALAIAQQRETFVVCDEAGEPLAPAIVWMDGRSTAEVRDACAELAAETIHELSGKVPCTTPSLFKIRMLLRRLQPELAAAEKRVVDVHGYLVHALTGRWVTSIAAADPLGLIDMRRADWSDPLCELASVRRAELCELVQPGDRIGSLRSDLELGLPRDVVLVAGAGDGQAAALGAGAIREGEAYLNIGTAVVAGTHVREYKVSRAFRTLFGAVPGTFLCESDLKGGTLTLDWLADRLLGGEERLEAGDARTQRLRSLEEKAERLAPGSDGLMALPYWSGVMNPHWDDDASGALIGLRPDHGAEHVYRAVCEALAFEQRLIFEAMEAELGRFGSVTCVGGGAARPFLLGLFATILDRDLRAPLCKPGEQQETTALGAAMLAAGGSGLAGSIEEAAHEMVKTGDGASACTFNKNSYRALYDEAYRDLYCTLAGTLARLALLRATCRRADSPR